MHNLHKLFRNNGGQGCLLTNLDIDAADRKALSKARTKIRSHLRLGVEQITAQSFGTKNRITPKFFTQGSWAYKTLNDPALIPPQEIDLDDGVYLPMSLINGASPEKSCNAFFSIVDVLLISLIGQNEGWKLEQKDTCCRVKINSKSHIDLPLYAIPDDEFIRLTEAARSRGYGSITEAALYDDTYTWLRLPSDRVWLAIRDGNWEQSDPRKVDEWFRAQTEVHREQYVHVCRYLKAWRDYHWDTGGPSSILLMVCASKEFKKYPGRDDLSLQGVAERLVSQLANDVDSPFADHNKPLNMLDVGERRIASNKAQHLYASLSTAINDTFDKKVSVSLLTNEFGCRIPNDPSLIDFYTHADVVRSHPKQVVPAPAIAKVKAG